MKGSWRETAYRFEAGTPSDLPISAPSWYLLVFYSPLPVLVPSLDISIISPGRRDSGISCNGEECRCSLRCLVARALQPVMLPHVRRESRLPMLKAWELDHLHCLFSCYYLLCFICPCTNPSVLHCSPFCNSKPLSTYVHCSQEAGGIWQI